MSVSSGKLRPGYQCDAASTIFNLPDYRVLEAVDLAGGGRRIAVEATSRPAARTAG